MKTMSAKELYNQGYNDGNAGKPHTRKQIFKHEFASPKYDATADRKANTLYFEYYIKGFIAGYRKSPQKEMA